MGVGGKGRGQEDGGRGGWLLLFLMDFQSFTTSPTERAWGVEGGGVDLTGAWRFWSGGVQLQPWRAGFCFNRLQSLQVSSRLSTRVNAFLPQLNFCPVDSRCWGQM